MTNTAIPHQAITAKPHYAILDGLRGVAALVVVLFHIFEAHATSHQDQLINHGYLAVDFFFLLSGFVIGYAYDDRWGKMTLGEFFKRRLVRLQPLVILGSIIGACFFYFQASPWNAKVADTPVWQMLVVMLIGCIMVPLPPSQDIRGWNETYPLNGPAWSLFYEYVANIFYALFGRWLTKPLLTVLVLLSAAALVYHAVFGEAGDMVGGWELSKTGLTIGFTRMMFPFFGGLLLFRMARVRHIKNAFLLCSILLIAALALPRFGGTEKLWINGLYEAAAIIIIFPLIVYMGAGGTVQGKTASRINKFLGDISYPIYITHYPLIYTYTAYSANNNQPPMGQAWPYMVLTFVGAVVLAYAALKLYDEPVRRWLKKKLG